MLRIIVWLVFLVLVFGNQSDSLGQSKAKNDQVLPFRIDQKYLSGLEIPKKKLKAHPNRQFFQKKLFGGNDLSVFILSSETAKNDLKDFPIDEFVYYLNGKAEVESTDGKKLFFYAGDYLFVPKGFSGTWKNIGGPMYHLELSVITNKRSGKGTDSKAKIPFQMDRNRLSGIKEGDGDGGKPPGLLYSGLELNVVTKSEKPGTKKIQSTDRDQFIHVLNGVVTVISNSTPGKEALQSTFRRGDFFILPKGFSGTWKTTGRHETRTLFVTPVKN